MALRPNHRAVTVHVVQEVMCAHLLELTQVSPDT